MTTIEDISSFDTADEEPDPLGLELDRLYCITLQLEQLHSEYFGCTPGVPTVFKVGRKALNSLTDAVEVVYRTAADVRTDIIYQFQQLRDDFLSIEHIVDRDGINDTDRAKLVSIEDELHNPGYKRFGLL